MAFWALNVLSVALVINHPVVTVVAGAGVLAILAWHERGRVEQGGG